MSTSARSGGSYLAIDLGASSGRVVVGTLAGAVMSMDEVHRFPTPMLECDGHLSWDVDAMWADIQRGIATAFDAGHRLRSISVDSWAVDYVPLDEHGTALRQPYAYRDQRTAGRMETAVRLSGGAAAVYERTGIQFLPFNTLPQILADVQDEPEMVAKTTTRLLIAEYFLYRLSGRKVAEATMASTTQLVDVRSGWWSKELLAAIGDDERRWPEIVPPGTTLGPLVPGLVPGGGDAPSVIATCAHDTAAAVAAVPAARDRAWAFISSGTWSLVGAELSAPILTDDARAAGFTNEAGIDSTVRFLKNRAGMWVLEELRREWEARGDRLSHDVLMKGATSARSLGITIDLNAPAFAERGGMMLKLEAACRAKDVAAPDTTGGIVRLILESLAASHANALEQLATVTGARANDIHIVGGGARNDLLNQLTADRTRRRVLAGPEEATVLGNLLVQARTLGDLPTGVSIREASRCSSRIREFTSCQR